MFHINAGLYEEEEKYIQSALYRHVNLNSNAQIKQTLIDDYILLTPTASQCTSASWEFSLGGGRGLKEETFYYSRIVLTQ